MNNSVRNEAQKVGIGALAVAVGVLALFFFLSKSGLGSAGPSAPPATAGSSMPAATEPSPAAT